MTAPHGASSARPSGWWTQLSLTHQNLQQKLRVAFALMSLIPLSVLAYFAAAYLAPEIPFGWHVPLVIAVCAVVALLGFIVARDLILPVARVAQHARTLAAGGALEDDTPLARTDEVGELSLALGRINQRIRDYVGQLQHYGGQVKTLNIEIHNRILAFSNLLQVSNLISQGVPLEEVLAYVVEKLSQVDETECYALVVPTDTRDQLLIQIACGAAPQAASLQGAVVSSAWLARVVRDPRGPVVVDDARRGQHESRELQRVFGLTNAVIAPAVSRGRCLALLVMGNTRPQGSFPDEVVETARVFAKQVAIAMETDRLAKQAKALTITDEVTGFYNEAYLRRQLEEEVRRAVQFHHPCAWILLALDGGVGPADDVLQQVADVLRGQVTPVDKIGRVHDGVFGVLVPERTKREAMAMAETIRRRVAEAGPRRLTVSVGVSENPLDGATGEELWTKAQDALTRAQAQGRDRVIAS